MHVSYILVPHTLPIYQTALQEKFVHILYIHLVWVVFWYYNSRYCIVDLWCVLVYLHHLHVYVCMYEPLMLCKVCMMIPEHAVDFHCMRNTNV